MLFPVFYGGTDERESGMRKSNLKIKRIHGTDIDKLVDALDSKRGKIQEAGIVYLDDEGYWNYEYTKLSNFSRVIFMLEYIKQKMMHDWIHGEKT